MSPPRATVLLISPEPWDVHFVSKHHYAIELARRGLRVLFLDPPGAQRDISLHAIPGHPNLEVVRGPRVAPGLRFMPGLLRRWLEGRWLSRLEDRIQCRIDVVWLFENSRFFDLGFAGDRLRIYHQVDLDQIFNPDLAARTADICFCTTEHIRRRLKRSNPRVVKVHHGLAEHLDPMPLDPDQLTRFSAQGVQAHAVYIGNFDRDYMDGAALQRTVQQHPEVRFHLVGGYTEEGPIRTRLRREPNIIWWGKIPSRQIPAVLERADIQLCTYRTDALREQNASPHKFMEYLAAGRVIVANDTAEYHAHPGLVEMVHDNADYPALFARVLAELPRLNSPEQQAQRCAFALDHSYERQLDRVIRLLDLHGLVHPFADPLSAAAPPDIAQPVTPGRVSIIMPAFNAGRFISAAIESVLKQSYPHWELLIVDDGSTDDTAAIVLTHTDARIRYFRQDNCGVSVARNVALDQASGEFIVLCDADDALPQRSLAARVEFLRRHPEVDLVDGVMCFMDESLGRELRRHVPAYSGPMRARLLALDDKVFVLPFYLFRRAKLGERRFVPGMSHSEDLMFFLDLSRGSDLRMGFVDECVYLYRSGHTSAMSNMDGLERGYFQLLAGVHQRRMAKLRTLILLRMRIARILLACWLARRAPGRAARAMLTILTGQERTWRCREARPC